MTTTAPIQQDDEVSRAFDKYNQERLELLKIRNHPEKIMTIDQQSRLKELSQRCELLCPSITPIEWARLFSLSDKVSALNPSPNNRN